MTDQRLERIENKLDQLQTSVSDFGRIEERLLSVFKSIDRHEKAINRNQDELTLLNQSVIKNSKTLQFAERAFWIAFTGCVSFFFYLGG